MIICFIISSSVGQPADGFSFLSFVSWFFQIVIKKPTNSASSTGDLDDIKVLIKIFFLLQKPIETREHDHDNLPINKSFFIFSIRVENESKVYFYLSSLWR